MSEEQDQAEVDEQDLEEEMLTAARSVIRTCMQVRPHENVLVVTDPTTSEVGRALYELSLIHI